MDLSPRAVIAGRYRVDTKVGAGGMGEVWLGEHIAVGVRVAVKTLLPAAAMNHEVVARFKREAYILGRIRSDNVARVVDFVADDLYGLVLVMEFVEGDPLSRLLQERTLTIEEGIDLALGLTSALKDLHGANIIHRDLKPGNVMMQPTPDGRRRAVVVDFGVSRLMSDKDKDEDEEITGITRADMAVGTIEYMAPEQILNSRNVAPGSDIYAAGAMLFRACAGRHVFGPVQSDTELAQKKLTTEAPALPLQRTDALAEGFAKVVARMVKRRPSERYKTADEVLADLLPLRAPRPNETDQGTLTMRGARAAAFTAPMPPGGVAPAGPPSQSSPQPISQPSSHPSQPGVSQVALQVGQMQGGPVSPNTPSHVSGSYPSPASSPSLPSPARDSLGAPVSGAASSTSQPARRGVPLVVTLGLVAAALAGGVFLGPRLMAPGGFDLTPAPSSTASAAPAAMPSSNPSASAAATDGTAGSAAPVAASASAGSAGLDAGADDGALDAGARDGGLAADAGARRFGDAGVGYPKPLPARQVYDILR